MGQQQSIDQIYATSTIVKVPPVHQMKQIQQGNDIRYGDIMVTQTQSGQFFAVKQNIFHDTEAWERYRAKTEAIITGQQDPFVVQTLSLQQNTVSQLCSTFTQSNTVYEFLPHDLQKDLEHLRETESNYDEIEIVAMMHGMISALIYFQNHRETHGDIRCSNILMTYPSLNNDEREGQDLPNPIYKLTSIHSMTQLNSYRRQLTGQHDDYTLILSPEQLAELKQSVLKPTHDPFKSDVFSIGVVAMEMATLVDMAAIYDQHSKMIDHTRMGQYIQQIAHDYSDQLAQLIEEYVKYNPEERPDIFSAQMLLEPFREDLEVYFGQRVEIDQETIQRKSNPRKTTYIPSGKTPLQISTTQNGPFSLQPPTLLSVNQSPQSAHNNDFKPITSPKFQQNKPQGLKIETEAEANHQAFLSNKVSPTFNQSHIVRKPNLSINNISSKPISPQNGQFFLNQQPPSQQVPRSNKSSANHSINHDALHKHMIDIDEKVRLTLKKSQEAKARYQAGQTVNNSKNDSSNQYEEYKKLAPITISDIMAFSPRNTERMENRDSSIPYQMYNPMAPFNNQIESPITTINRQDESSNIRQSVSPSDRPLTKSLKQNMQIVQSTVFSNSPVPYFNSNHAATHSIQQPITHQLSPMRFNNTSNNQNTQNSLFDDPNYHLAPTNFQVQAPKILNTNETQPQPTNITNIRSDTPEQKESSPGSYNYISKQLRETRDIIPKIDLSKPDKNELFSAKQSAIKGVENSKPSTPYSSKDDRLQNMMVKAPSTNSLIKSNPKTSQATQKQVKPSTSKPTSAKKLTKPTTTTNKVKNQFKR